METEINKQFSEEEISNCGKGAYHSKDNRDYIFGSTATVPFDWTQPIVFNINLPISNQNGSLSCVAQSTMNMAKIFYFYRQQVLQDFSSRFIYSQIFLPISGGAYLRDGIATLLKRGIQLNATFPSDPPTEEHMRDKTGLNYNEASKYDIYPDDYAYASVPCQIDAIATAIRDNTCVMLGIRGNNAGWTQAIITPPTSMDWSHAVVGIGAEIIDGKKYIRFINSWSDRWGDRGTGLLSEDYFNSGNVVAAYVVTTNFVKPMQDKLTTSQVRKLYTTWGKESEEEAIQFWGDGTHELDEILDTHGKDATKAYQNVFNN